METLQCQTGHTWQRPLVRGRKPKLCPDCRADPSTGARGCAVSDDSNPGDTQVSPKQTKPDKDLSPLPLAKRTSGWCTDYDPAPAAQHVRCDGDLGKYRCPCDCHGWKDTK